MELESHIMVSKDETGGCVEPGSEPADSTDPTLIQGQTLCPPPLPLTDKGDAVDSNVFHSLCEVLNWSDDEAQAVVHFLSAGGGGAHLQKDTSRQDFAIVVQVLRRIGPEVAKLWSARSPDMCRRGGIVPPSVTPFCQRVLARIANKSATEFALMPVPYLSRADLPPAMEERLRAKDLPPHERQAILENALRGAPEPPMVLRSLSGYQPHTTRLIWATQALWAIFEGEKYIRRCPAPAPGKGGNSRCDRYFVSDPTLRHPNRYCSATCRKRHERERLRERREREARERGHGAEGTAP